ncbi:hypothetical protein P152DRAFT_267987 [Eremomyces bilateralis CBS 781.70]|uniref:Uncharacterized protein n=1 Tax=Eremomyces bilateralis CBS 781.70 TaxID=1392243 RepID=A0A6G1G8G9_9PEZI|nr:uncharacterized protein P152DRAFT_267987 [Eremomyces bilateralis CBS 781.70]KAF1814334.1 hypothetical protein P152DRAFT_267987 [Eremomyces bilateralis CBS 781.70]
MHHAFPRMPCCEAAQPARPSCFPTVLLAAFCRLFESNERPLYRRTSCLPFPLTPHRTTSIAAFRHSSTVENLHHGVLFSFPAHAHAPAPIQPLPLALRPSSLFRYARRLLPTGLYVHGRGPAPTTSTAPWEREGFRRCGNFFCGRMAAGAPNTSTLDRFLLTKKH